MRIFQRGSDTNDTSKTKGAGPDLGRRKQREGRNQHHALAASLTYNPRTALSVTSVQAQKLRGSCLKDRSQELKFPTRAGPSPSSFQLDGKPTTQTQNFWVNPYLCHTGSLANPLLPANATGSPDNPIDVLRRRDFLLRSNANPSEQPAASGTEGRAPPQPLRPANASARRGRGRRLRPASSTQDLVPPRPARGCRLPTLR